MNTWSKVFLGVIIAAAIAVVVLAAVELHVRNTGQQHVASLEKKIAETQEKIDKIESGTAPLKLPPDKTLKDFSFAEIQGILARQYDERGRAWFGCRVAGMDESTLPPALQQMEAQVIITGPLEPSAMGAAPSVVRPDSLRGVVYVFQEGGVSQESGIEPENNAGSFHGRFKVDSDVPVETKFMDDKGNEINGWRVSLITIDPIGEDEIETIANASDSRWAIYMSPPVDRVAGVFSQLTEAELQMIPQEIRDRLSRQMPQLEPEDLEGVPPAVAKIWEAYRNEWDDPESEFARDFAALLDWLYQQRSRLRRDINVALSDSEMFKEAEKKSKAENEELEKDAILEEKRRDAMTEQRNAVEELLKQRTEEVNSIELQMEKIQTLSEALLLGIAEAQVKAVEKIEERINRSE
ncbi:MAG: hypothetical protein LBI05_09585 [Planctomycetaceae bacterium]|jgi:hypothetical protein|nr:hypothetical protein [Planctomycetaceae bacterium]